MTAAQAARRAAYELDRVADAIEQDRHCRKARSHTLIPNVIRNEAERARDVLHVYGLLDV